VADIFRIETDQTQFSWGRSVNSPDEPEPESTHADGRLAISLSAQARKKIRIWRRGLSDETASNPEVQVGPRLYEETPYSLLLRSTNQRRVELRHRDPAILQAVHDSTDGSIVHGTVDFRNQIGRSRFSVYVEGNAEYDFEVEVFPGKLDYVADYNVLLADTEEILTGLPLEYLRATFQTGFTTDSESSSRLEWILLLRHVINDLERGLHYVRQHPHHGLIRECVPTRVERLRRPDRTTLKMIAQGKGQGSKSRTVSGLVVHSKLPERRARITWDTPEHRWLAFQLSRIRQNLAEIHLAERKKRTHNRLRQLRTIEEIAELENRIAALQSLEPIAQAQGFAAPGFTSLTLQARPGYREAYRACLLLLQALRVDGGPVGLSVKDTDCLYKYWCYLALLRLVGTITGEQVPARELFSIEQDGLRVRLKRGTTQTVKFSNSERAIELTYNPRYNDETFILPQKPDLVLTLQDSHSPTMRLVFDARYPINPGADYVKQFGSPGPPPEAIDVLHRYRDVILEETGFQGSRSETLKQTVVEGVALFPYADVNDQFRSSSLWSSLERFGIGAIPFLPRETRYLEEWLRVVLQRTGWLGAENTMPDSSPAYLRAWHEAEKDLVLVGMLRQNAEEHLDWIKRQRCYYTVFTSSQPRQLVSRWVAIYSPKSIRTPEAVTHLAAVEKIEIKQRHEIDTPWLPLRRGNEQQVVYRVGEVRELEKPIENRRLSRLAARFVKNRWTSRLGLMRAIDVSELFLETSAEWRLYEHLRLAGLDFRLKLGVAGLQDRGDPRGRTWFVKKRLRVQYRGAAGFLIRRSGLRDEYRSEVADVVRYFT
jgi:predicted component of viral defense system (DUF524 family)